MRVALHRSLPSVSLPIQQSVVRSKPRRSLQTGVSFSDCASTQEGGGIVKVLEERKKLQRDLEISVQREDYAYAASLQRQLEALENSHPLLQKQKQLQQAIDEERYKDAAQLQAELVQLQAQLGSAALAELGGSAASAESTSSEAVTAGIRVRVTSFYIPAHSTPPREYLFGYQVTITNETSDKVVQLRSRHWVITDQDGNKQEVRGAGVVGQQPVLLPSKAFTYSSGCPLPTPSGSMEGSYQLVVLDEADGQFRDKLDVRVAKFKLSTEGNLAV